MTDVEETAPAPKRGTRTPKANVPHVYTAMLEVLRQIAVTKDGLLPANMGGKSYASAQAISAEAKRLFVEQGLIFLPREREVSKKVINNNGRITVAITIEGSYEIISTVDGSSTTIQGSGDGLTSGSSVSSSIASTFARKNALMGAFMITEQSAEEAGKDGIPDAAVNRDLAKAANTPTPTVKGSPSKEVLDLRAEVKRLGSATNSDWSAIGNALAKGKVWASDVGILKQVVEKLKEALPENVNASTGEVTD